MIAQTELRSSGVAIVTLDDPDTRINTITAKLVHDLGAAIDALRTNGHAKAIVLRGKPGSFLAGANLETVRAIRFAAEAEDAARAIAKRFAFLANGQKPVVAWLEGPALGGGFELALACTACVATEGATMGLPEVKLGLLPAANGLLRVAERAGLRAAIDLGLTGRNIHPHEALARGLVDEIGDLEAACALAKKLAERPMLRETLPRTRARRGRSLSDLAIEGNPIGRAVVLKKAREETERKTRGNHPAAERILDVLGRWSVRGFAAAASLEARLFGELVVSETADRLIDLFFAEAATRKPLAAEARSLARIGVVGAGLMGSAIASASLKAGLEVRLKEKDDIGLGRGLRWVSESVALRPASRGRESESLDRAATLARLSGTTAYAGFARMDLVVEAVVEDLAQKQAIVRELEARVGKECVIASHTHAIPIARIASVAAHPERIVGMHWFHPVEKRPLVEVVATPVADPRAIATAVALGRLQKKTVIVVKDGPGFYTSRILAPYLAEAVRLVGEGFAVDVIDRALADWGFPKGPLETIDELGLDVALDVLGTLEMAFGERMRRPDAMKRLHDDDRRGKKNGRGFYLHGHVDDTVYRVLDREDPRRSIPEDLSLRCSLAMINEAMRCLEDGVVASPAEGDVGAVLGLGFPAFRGGPFRWVDVLGPPDALRRMRSLEQRFGARFEPAPVLVDMARTGKRFYE